MSSTVNPAPIMLLAQSRELKVLITQSCPTLCNSMDCRLFCPWTFPSKNTGMDSYSLLQGAPAHSKASINTWIAESTSDGQKLSNCHDSNTRGQPGTTKTALLVGVPTENELGRMRKQIIECNLHTDVFLYTVISSVQFSRLAVSDSLRPHESQHARPPCPSPTPRVHPNPCH